MSSGFARGGFARNRFAVKLFQRLLGFAGWLQGMPGRMTPPPMRLIQIGSLYWQSRVLYVAAQLDIASILADRTMDIEALAGEAGCHADSLHRLLRMLISMDIFAESKPGMVANNRLSAHLDRAHPQCVRAMILMHNSPEMTRPWAETLEEGIRRGDMPFRLAHGSDLFGYMEGHADFAALFADAMDSTDALVGDAFLADFDWGRYRSLIDVGGSKGLKAAALLKRYPDMRAVVFDLPATIAEAQAYWRQRDDDALSSRIDFVAGDARREVPGDGDLYLLCAVMHGLGDADCVAILSRIREASSGDVAIIDAVLAGQGESLMLTAFDMQMLIGTEGRERTAAEWQQLFERAGYRLVGRFDTRSLWKLQLLRPIQGL